ncbi:MAG TPA: FAD-dependent oxidoreductase, partial [Armatimonadota bacterium]|nr:FAD-dependent oxidoreductase [Armatimonadota bacterium]
HLGGMGTAGGVNVFMSYTHIGGVFREVLARLSEIGGRRGAQFEPEALKIVLDEMVLESGVKLLLHTKGIGVETTDAPAPAGSVQRTGWERITGVVINNKSGTQLVKAKLYIDATGDGDLAYYAGAEYKIGREEDGQTQPMTMMFRLGGCEWTGINPMSIDAMKDIHMTVYDLPNEGEVLVNMTRLTGLSGVSGEDMTQAELRGRQEVREAVEILRNNMPGMSEAFLISTPAQIGVRETRRIIGATVVSEEDLVTARHFPDVMARSTYGIDIHNPTGTGARMVKMKAPYEVPYRSMIPKGLTNLIVTGRCISTTHEALSAIRVQPTMYGVGEGSGTAAAVCIAHGVGPWDMGPYVKELQTRLIKQGADLGEKGAGRVNLVGLWRRNVSQYGQEDRYQPRPFVDVPLDSPIYEAVEAVRKAGVTSGVGDGKFGPEVVLTRMQAIAFIGRGFDVILGPLPSDRLPELPKSLAGQWWSGELQTLVGRGAVEPGELTDLRLDEPCSQRQLWKWWGQPLVDEGILVLNEPSPENIRALVQVGMAVESGEYVWDLDLPAKRAHAALLAGALLAWPGITGHPPGATGPRGPAGPAGQ